MTPVAIAAIGLVAAIVSGCVSGGRTRFTLLALRDAPNFRSLGEVVEGQSCSSPLQTDDYRLAAEAAISRIPGANALSDVTLLSRETLDGGFCLTVRGTAGVLE